MRPNMRRMPEGFAADARVLTQRELMRKYHTGPVVLSRWLDEMDFRRGRGNHKRPVAQCDADTGELLAVYPSITDAARGTYVSVPDIWKCCNGISKTSAGFAWRYYNEKEKAQ